MHVENHKTALEGFAKVILDPIDHARVIQYVDTVRPLQNNAENPTLIADHFSHNIHNKVSVSLNDCKLFLRKCAFERNAKNIQDKVKSLIRSAAQLTVHISHKSNINFHNFNYDDAIFQVLDFLCIIVLQISVS
jgi:hypothetical protein